MTKTIMDEALEEVRRKGRLDIQERVFAKMKPHDPLADLVAGFSKALLEKLRAAEAKYGYKNDWLRSDWEAECQKHLAEHLAKGDPRDVAAYAAFCWHHGWPTSALEAALAHPGSGDAEPVAWRNAIIEECAKVAVAKSRWAERMVEDHGADSVLFGTIGNTADDIADLIRALATDGPVLERTP